MLIKLCGQFNIQEKRQQVIGGMFETTRVRFDQEKGLDKAKGGANNYEISLCS